jgi:hypothetical protein
MNIDFLDLHAGTLDIASVGEYPPAADGSNPTAPITLYRLSNGKFMPTAAPILFEDSITQDSSAEQKIDLTFPKPVVPGPYILKIANGDRSGRNRFSSGTVSLNSYIVVTPSTLSAATDIASIPVSLKDENSIEFELLGPVGAVLSVLVQGQPSGDVNGDGEVNCKDLQLVKASMGKKTGQPGFDPEADVNLDGVVDVKDLAIVASQLSIGSTCK